MAMATDIGIVDLGIGFPYTSVEQKMHAYDFFRANLKDAQSQQEMEFPVQYIFKGVPDVVDEGPDVVEWVLEKMDAFNQLYCDMLRDLHRAFNGVPTLMFATISSMRELKTRAQELMQQCMPAPSSTLGRRLGLI